MLSYRTGQIHRRTYEQKHKQNTYREYRQADRQTNKKDRQTKTFKHQHLKHPHPELARYTYINIKRNTDRNTYREYRQTGRHTNKKDRQTNRQTDRNF